MCIVWVGNCDRCARKVEGKPGLHYADTHGEFGYCEECLAETGLGDKAGGYKRDSTKWLDEVITRENQEFLLGKAKPKWDLKRLIERGVLPKEPQRSAHREGAKVGLMSWGQWLEGKESMEDKEERLHRDLDGDGEKGEPAEHRRKVLGPKWKCRGCGRPMKDCECKKRAE